MEDGVEVVGDSLEDYLGRFGGPVNPVAVPLREGPTQFLGMTLRDDFAGRAMQGFAQELGWGQQPSDVEHIAKDAYAWADAMLKARSA